MKWRDLTPRERFVVILVTTGALGSVLLAGLVMGEVNFIIALLLATLALGLTLAGLVLTHRRAAPPVQDTYEFLQQRYPNQVPIEMPMRMPPQSASTTIPAYDYHEGAYTSYDPTFAYRDRQGSGKDAPLWSNQDKLEE